MRAPIARVSLFCALLARLITPPSLLLPALFPVIREGRRRSLAQSSAQKKGGKNLSDTNSSLSPQNFTLYKFVRGVNLAFHLDPLDTVTLFSSAPQGRGSSPVQSHQEVCSLSGHDATTELGRDLAKSRHDQASPCSERVNKVNCVPRTARRKLQPFTKYPGLGGWEKKIRSRGGQRPSETDHETA